MDPVQTRKVVDAIIDRCQREFAETLPDVAQAQLGKDLQELIQHSLVQSTSAEFREVTILLSDLRGFTAMSEQMSPMDVAKLLNRYFACMSQVVFKYGGAIDKFMGDAIMVLFGAPTTGDHDLLRAVACAAEMQIAMDALNQESDAEGLPMIYMGIGIDTGRVFAGTLGSELHREYTVIGDHVNLASRIEAHSLRGQVLLSERSYEMVEPYVEINGVREVLMKGARDAVKVYELKAINTPQRLEIPQQEWRHSPRVQVDMPFRFQLLDDKTVTEQVHKGRILDISYHGILAWIGFAPAPGQQLKLDIALGLMSNSSAAIYAQVLRHNVVGENYECSIEFCSMDQDAERAVREFVDRNVG